MLPALCFFTLALMSKPMAVSLPFVLLILDWYPLQRIISLRTFKTVFIEKLPFIALSLIGSILTILAQKEAIVPMGLVPLPSRVLVGIAALAVYLWNLILPLNLTPYYPYPRNISPFLPEYLAAVALAVALTAVTLLTAKKHRLWLAAWVYYAITLIPVLGIVQVGGQAMADRYMYLPSLGPFLLIGLAVGRGSSKGNALSKKERPAAELLVASIVIAVCISLSYLTFGQIRVWKNAISLWSRVVEYDPDNVPIAYYNRGIAFDKAGQYSQAIEDFGKAITLNPSYFDAYNNRGMTLEKIDRIDMAIGDFGKAISLNPAYYQAFYNRALLFERIGQDALALQDYDSAIALNPSYYEAYNNRGIVFDKLGRYNKAIDSYAKVIALNPSHFEAFYNLGIVFGKTAVFDKAVKAFTQAININPNYPYAYGSRGLAYYHLGQYGDALADFNKALGLDYNYSKAYVNRGNVYLKTGNQELAGSDFRKACDLGDEEGCNALKLGH
jgi:tetratricopeptide (TPR) repeat protein